MINFITTRYARYISLFTNTKTTHSHSNYTLIFGWSALVYLLYCVQCTFFCKIHNSDIFENLKQIEFWSSTMHVIPNIRLFPSISIRFWDNCKIIFLWSCWPCGSCDLEISKFVQIWTNFNMYRKLYSCDPKFLSISHHLLRFLRFF